jgi:hypothetical protein
MFIVFLTNRSAEGSPAGKPKETCEDDPPSRIQRTLQKETKSFLTEVNKVSKGEIGLESHAVLLVEWHLIAKIRSYKMRDIAQEFWQDVGQIIE